MSAPAETEAKPVAPVVEESSVIPAETDPPAKEHKKLEEDTEEKKRAKKGEAKPVYPVPAVEEGRMGTETDPPVEKKPAEMKTKGGKVSRRLSTRITAFFKKEAKVKGDIHAIAEKAPKLAEVARVSAPLYEPAYPIPAVEEGRMETETTSPEEAQKLQTKAEEKPAEKRVRDANVSRRISIRIVGLFKKEAKVKDNTPVVAEEAPKLVGW